jgi:hypothetical protein
VDFTLCFKPKAHTVSLPITTGAKPLLFGSALTFPQNQKLTSIWLVGAKFYSTRTTKEFKLNSLQEYID